MKEDDILVGHESPIEAVAWHPKGKILASVSGTSEILFHSRRSGKVDRILEAEGAKFTELAFHPKGKWIAASSLEGKLFVWDLSKDELVGQASRVEGREAFVALVTWGEGDALLAASGKEILRIDVKALGK
ncbi:WD domain, G-beta repeat [Planctomycetes bacterium Poly30]|uniref:WD domain, G-beta repeat n=1 Tax=Saltatorellus ferox TaxID=2528018 RepID=A0A518F010_9BACT|nr:WD domain, G-beta repeat [Planctomycetes bacterium Poly30]